MNMVLSDCERVALIQLPTPLDPLPNLTRFLGGPTLYIKRDDCTGLAFGGNKSRKLEFVFGDARRQGASHLITHGATQSNHVCQTAAAAARFGMKFTGLLERRVDTAATDYRGSGNVLLDRLIGARLIECAGGTDMNEAMAAVARQLEAAGERPYVVPGGASYPLGALGYVDCAAELDRQARQLGIRIDCVVHGTGSGGTQAGLVTGFAMLGGKTRVLGISVRHPRERQENLVHAIAQATAEYLRFEPGVNRKTCVVDSNFVGTGYGLPTPQTLEAIETLARLEGIFLDPVYTGKGMAGLMQLVREQRFSKSDTVVFLHTGGAAALFAYRDYLEERMKAA
jgi:L-cysteate sulfo-lyase